MFGTKIDCDADRDWRGIGYTEGGRGGGEFDRI